MARNSFEEAARAKKIRRLISVLDEHFAWAGMSRDDGLLAADFLSRWTAQQWRELALQAGCHEPSDPTIREIVAEYRTRGTSAQFSNRLNRARRQA
jgi:hypothetical protein